MRILPSEADQALRCRRVLMASVAYLLWMSVAAYLFGVGLLRIHDVSTLLSVFLVILGTNATVFGIVRSGLNRRFRDPSLTYPQIIVAIAWAMVLVAFTVPEARGPVLLLFTTVFFFGIFRLRTRQFIELAILAILLYAGLVLWEADVLERQQLQIAVAHVLVLAAVLLWMSFMGGYVARLRADLRKAVSRIEILAHTDDLTGTENRRSITASLRDAIESGHGKGGKVGICLLDIDRFKRINDQFGHPIGDEVLQQFVSRVERALRERDVVDRGPWPDVLGRFGGEEFLVVLRDSDEGGASLVAERIRGRVSGDAFGTEAGPVSVTVSAGVAGWRPGEDEVDLLRRADRALYRAKDEGRNRVCRASEG